MVLFWTKERHEEGTGRRHHEHSGGLALASDTIPELNQNNIRSGLVTLRAYVPGLSHPSGCMLPQTDEKRQAAKFPSSLPGALAPKNPDQLTLAALVS